MCTASNVSFCPGPACLVVSRVGRSDLTRPRDLSPLLSLCQLRSLTLPRESFTPAQIESFRRALPGCRIYLM